MALTVTRSNIRLIPDHKKVIPRFLNTGNDRSLMIIQNVAALTDSETDVLLSNILLDFSARYKNIQAIFLKHFDQIKYLLTEEQLALPEEKNSCSVLISPWNIP